MRERPSAGVGMTDGDYLVNFSSTSPEASSCHYRNHQLACIDISLRRANSHVLASCWRRDSMRSAEVFIPRALCHGWGLGCTITLCGLYYCSWCWKWRPMWCLHKLNRSIDVSYIWSSFTLTEILSGGRLVTVWVFLPLDALMWSVHMVIHVCIIFLIIQQPGVNYSAKTTVQILYCASRLCLYVLFQCICLVFVLKAFSLSFSVYL